MEPVSVFDLEPVEPWPGVFVMQRKTLHSGENYCPTCAQQLCVHKLGIGFSGGHLRWLCERCRFAAHYPAKQIVLMDGWEMNSTAVQPRKAHKAITSSKELLAQILYFSVPGTAAAQMDAHSADKLSDAVDDDEPG